MRQRSIKYEMMVNDLMVDDDRWDGGWYEMVSDEMIGRWDKINNLKTIKI